MRIDNFAELADLDGADARAAARGEVYMAAQQAAAALGTALTATMVTLALVNPVSSKKFLKVLWAGVSVHSPPGGIAGYVLGIVSPPAVDPITNTSADIRRSDGGSGDGEGLCYTAATLGAVPVVIDTLGAIAATGYVGESHFGKTYETLYLGPGSSVCIQGLTTASTGICAFRWREITIR